MSMWYLGIGSRKMQLPVGAGGLPATDISAGWGLGLKRTGPVSVLWKNRQGEETCGEVGAGIY